MKSLLNKTLGFGAIRLDHRHTQSPVDKTRDSRRDGPAANGQVLRFRKGAAGRATSNSTVESSDCSTGELFALVWQALADVLGTAAAATLLRRAAQRAEPRWPELEGLSITRENLDYGYVIPPSWDARGAEPSQALCELVRELWMLLVELTGHAVVQRLERISELRDRGMIPTRGADS
jgi:hypothetical protein